MLGATKLREVETCMPTMWGPPYPGVDNEDEARLVAPYWQHWQTCRHNLKRSKTHPLVRHSRWSEYHNDVAFQARCVTSDVRNVSARKAAAYVSPTTQSPSIPTLTRCTFSDVTPSELNMPAVAYTRCNKTKPTLAAGRRFVLSVTLHLQY